jgi:phosphoglycerate dehydrogenase-like enzyme
MTSKQPAIAILDDYQGVALKMADWSVLEGKATITVFDDHVDDPQAIVDRLHPFDVVCVMRERTPLTAVILEQLPNLRLIASTGSINASVDVKTAAARGIEVVHTGYDSTPAIELTWALILSSVRHIAEENASLRSGGWQRHVGDDLAGRTLGVIGLGQIGGAVATIGRAFRMNVIAWSQNLTAARAQDVGVRAVPKDELSAKRTSRAFTSCSADAREVSSPPASSR